MIISIASAFLLARGGSQGPTDTAVFAQLGRYPLALATVGVLMAAFALVPGLPFVPFMVGAVGLFTAAYFGRRALEKAEEEERAAAELPEEAPPQASMGDILELDDIHPTFPK